MRERDTFGTLLRAFRIRLGAPRQRVEWLAGKLGYPASTIYGWENGDPSKGLPSRATLLSIGQLYSLCPDEVNRLIAMCGTERKHRTHAARYAPLTLGEMRAWAPLVGPLSSTIGVWREQLQGAQAAYIAGELQSARRLAESLLRQITAVKVGVCGADLWSDDERDEMYGLWLLAWREFFESSALLETGATIAQSCAPYVAQARTTAGAVRDPHLKALALHLEGDYYHNQARHATALDCHREALHHLGGRETDPALAAMIQRLIILDGMHVLPREQLETLVRKGRHMAERLGPDHAHARILLAEAVGRALGILRDADCWSILADAQTEARQRFPVGYVTTLYSRMLALANAPRGGDRDQLRSIASHAFTLATYSNWQRRIEQIQQTGAACGIELGPLA
ncbi:MAG TPA: helix-turn-helix transcriptional regulator [Ktedonobacterales bacterium]|nr:helix-turn-helix transcriptional regulator [Ktedonobacterales bacterium]